MLHEVIAETYIPLLSILYDLRMQEVPFRLTVGVTPVLAEQLVDPDVLDAFETFLLEELQRAQADVERFQKAEHSGASSNSRHFLYLARFYADWYHNLLLSFRERFDRDLIGAFRRLQDEGYIEILTSAATHGYLPLMERDSTIYAQLKTGVTSYLRHFGRLPRGAWLPECGYRPAFYSQEGEADAVRPGLEEFLADLNLRYTVVETHAFDRSLLGDDAGGEDIGPYREVPPRKLVARVGKLDGLAGDIPSPFSPRYIQGSNVAAYARDAHTGRQVWSASDGYPGDYVYREFHRKDNRSGLQYWRITGEAVSLDQKELYDPYHAFHRAREHASHFIELVQELLQSHFEQVGEPGIVVAAYDTELFGHWWFEGIPWMKEVLTRLGESEEISLTTTGEYLEAYPPEETIALPEGSWGQGGGHSTWLNATTEWMWPLVHGAERRMERLVARYPDTEGDRLAILKQLARELLLLQSSDWPFLLNTGQAAEYATARFQEHLARFNRLALLVDRDSLSEDERTFLQECQRLDNPFFNIDYRAFMARGEMPEP
jgi:1,4-alpha-glucan branching enzyme